MRNDQRDSDIFSNDEEFAVPQGFHTTAAELRTSFIVSDGFEQRVMNAVRQEARDIAKDGVRARKKGMSIVLTPFRMAAAAVLLGTALVVTAVLSSMMTRARHAAVSSPSLAKIAHDTTYVVRFVYAVPKSGQPVHRVSLVGDFNGWAKGETMLRPSEVSGVWTTTVVLPPGRHEYAFVVHSEDGEQWDTDPASVPLRDEFGTETSVVNVGEKPSFHS